MPWARVPNDGGIVFAGQYDESAWHDGGTADARPLDRLHADARAMLVRIDSHSCIVNRRTFEGLALPADTNGIERDAAGEPTGKLFLDANWRAQSAFMARLPLDVDAMPNGARSNSLSQTARCTYTRSFSDFRAKNTP